MRVRTLLVVILAGCGSSAPPVAPPPPPVPPGPLADAPPPPEPTRPTGTRLSSADTGSCVIAGDGVPVCWGQEPSAEIRVADDGRRLMRIPEVTGAVEIAVGIDDACARTESGRIVCWGWVSMDLADEASEEGVDLLYEDEDDDGPPRIPLLTVSGLSAPTDLAVPWYGRGGCAVAAYHDGSAVYCFGSPLDPGADTPPRLFAQAQPVAGTEGAVEVGIGDTFACARIDDGTVRCWGENDVGQLGDGSDERRDDPVAVSGIDDARELAVGESTSCVLREGGRISCWGGGLFGERGRDPEEELPLTATDVAGLTDAVRIFAGGEHVCVITERGDVLCWGSNRAGELGNGSTELSYRPVPAPGLRGVLELSIGSAHLCGRRADDRIVCVGNGGDGQLGVAVDRSLPAALEVTGLRARRLLAAGERTCAEGDDGVHRCFGDLGGDLGLWQSIVPRAWAEVGSHAADMPLAGGCQLFRDGRMTCPSGAAFSGVVQADGSYRASCARLRDGTVQCAATRPGASDQAPGPLAGSIEPATVTGVRGAVDLTVHEDGACAALRDGRVLCWGRVRIFGDETLARPTEPAALRDVVDVDLAAGALCARTRGGAVICLRTHDTPAPDLGLQNATALCSGGTYRCSLHEDGQVRCWGGRQERLLGSGVQTRPLAVPGVTGADALVCGNRHACARRQDGRVLCWGEGDDGQLGAMPPWVRFEPVEVPLR